MLWCCLLVFFFIYVNLDLYATTLWLFSSSSFLHFENMKKKIFLLYVLVSILLSDVVFVIFHHEIYVIAKSKQCFIGHLYSEKKWSLFNTKYLSIKPDTSFWDSWFFSSFIFPHSVGLWLYIWGNDCILHIGSESTMCEWVYSVCNLFFAFAVKRIWLSARQWVVGPFFPSTSFSLQPSRPFNKKHRSFYSLIKISYVHTLHTTTLPNHDDECVTVWHTFQFFTYISSSFILTWIFG